MLKANGILTSIRILKPNWRIALVLPPSVGIDHLTNAFYNSSQGRLQRIPFDASHRISKADAM
jgi:hypothetical protein